MFELNISLIGGMMLGIEFPDISEVNDELSFLMVVDLLIFRLQLVKWRNAE